MDKKLIITINREYGSGGRIIGQQLSEKLGIPYYDDEIIKMASEHSAVAEQYFRMNDEKPGHNILQRIIGGIKNANNKPSIGDDIVSPDNLFRFESEVIRELVASESCILIGRCADFVLSSAGEDDFVSLFVYADLSKKVDRVMDFYGLKPKEALRRVQRNNRIRKEYYKYYTGEEWDDMTHYDLPLNTSKITLEQGVDLILEYLRIRGKL